MDRREFIKRADLVGTGTLLGVNRVFAKTTNGSGKDSRPGEIKNILLLFVDQQRQDCIRCYGNPIVQTPNIDNLARNGIRFYNVFTPTPLCSPARTSLQTGLWAHNTRVMFNTGHGGLTGGVNDPDPKIGFSATH